MRPKNPGRGEYSRLLLLLLLLQRNANLVVVQTSTDLFIGTGPR